MHASYLCTVACLAAGGLLLGCGGRGCSEPEVVRDCGNHGGEDAAQNELKKIEGTWRFVSRVRVDGKPNPPEQLARWKLTITGEKWSVLEDGKLGNAGVHKFDPTKKPAQLDVLITKGEEKGSYHIGIYELEGDTMKVCLGFPNKERPTSFTPELGQYAVVFQREQEKP